MAFQRTSVGIEIGTHAVKVVHLKVTDRGAFIQNALYYDRANLVARGVDPDDVGAVAALLASQLAAHRIPMRGVVLSISGSDSILRYTSVPPVPPWRLNVIMKYEVEEVADKVGESLASDFRVLPVPREAGDEQVVLIGLSKETSLQFSLDALESAGVFVDRAIPAPVALYGAHEAFGTKSDPDSPTDDVTVIVDIGCSNVHTVVVLNDRLAYARSVRYGGRNFTEAVAKDLGLDFDSAEALKIRFGSVDPTTVTSDQSQTIVNALRGCAAQVVNLIQGSLRLSKTQARVDVSKPTRVVLLGGGSRLSGLTQYLKRALHAPTEAFHPGGVVATGDLEPDAARVFGSYPGDFSVPIGLAATGVRDGGFSLNVLPRAYVERRRFRDRTLFMYAAGVLLVLNLVFGFFTAWRVNAAARARVTELDGKISQLETYRSETEENRVANEQARERINRLLADVEITSFQSYIVDLLSSKQLPTQIMVTRVSLSVDEDDELRDVTYRLLLTGKVDDSSGEGNDLLDSLLQTLKSKNFVAAADFLSVEASGTQKEFELLVAPAFEELTPTF